MIEFGKFVEQKKIECKSAFTGASVEIKGSTDSNFERLKSSFEKSDLQNVECSRLHNCAFAKEEDE